MHGFFTSIKLFFQFIPALLKLKPSVTPADIKIVFFSSVNLKHILCLVSIPCATNFAAKISCHFYILSLKKNFKDIKHFGEETMFLMYF